MADLKQKEARLAEVTRELATALYQESEAGRSIRELAELTGLTPGLTAGLIALGGRMT